MIDRRFYAPFLLIALGVAFVFLSYAIRVSRNKRARLIGWKMKVGACLLTLQTFSGCFTYHRGMCYRSTVSTQSAWLEKNNFGLHLNAGVSAINSDKNVYTQIEAAIAPNFHRRYGKGCFSIGPGMRYSWCATPGQGMMLGSYAQYTYLVRPINSFIETGYYGGITGDLKNAKYYSVGAGIRVNNIFGKYSYASGFDLFGRCNFISTYANHTQTFEIGIRFYSGMFGD
jgi:hypothetical protein